MIKTPPSFGKRLERSEDINEGEPLELKAKINGSPQPTVTLFYILKILNLTYSFRSLGLKMVSLLMMIESKLRFCQMVLPN